MGKPYSLDLRERIIGFVGGGRSRREAADRFGVSPSCAIKLVDRWDRTGSAAPGKRGGSVGKLAPHKDFLLGRVKDKPDITMPELAEALKAKTGTEAAPASLSRFLIRHGQRFKKNAAGQRTKTSRGRSPAR
jgi:transposase